MPFAHDDLFQVWHWWLVLCYKKQDLFVCLFSVFVLGLTFFAQSSLLKRCFFVLFSSALILSSKDVFEEFVLNSPTASPLMKPLLTKGGWHEEKCVWVPLLWNVCPHQAVIPFLTSCLHKQLLVSVSDISAMNLVVGWCLFACSMNMVISFLVAF